MRAKLPAETGLLGADRERQLRVSRAPRLPHNVAKSHRDSGRLSQTRKVEQTTNIVQYSEERRETGFGGQRSFILLARRQRRATARIFDDAFLTLPSQTT